MDLPDCAIDQVLLESLPTHPVGIDLELLVRRDLLGTFNSEMDSMGWNSEDDPSVKSTPYSQEEVFYTPIEISTVMPKPVGTLIRDLTRILAWLKHQDFVGYNKDDGDITSSVTSPAFATMVSSLTRRPSALAKLASVKKVLKKFGFDLIKLPRGKSPMNLSAGCHLHFDIKSWFDSGDHVERFIRLFYASSGQIKGQIIPGRYSFPGERADLYANFDRKLGGYISKGDPSDPRHRAVSLLGKEKKLALNAWQAWSRGDLEIRVFHSSLNIATITHWFSLIISMIEKTRSSSADWSSLDPEVKAETKKRSQAMTRSKFQGLTPSGYSRSVSRILGRNVD